MAVLSCYKVTFIWRQATGEDIDGCLVLLQSHLYLGDKLQERASLAVLYLSRRQATGEDIVGCLVFI